MDEYKPIVHWRTGFSFDIGCREFEITLAADTSFRITDLDTTDSAYIHRENLIELRDAITEILAKEPAK